jgi:hypothetical protein
VFINRLECVELAKIIHIGTIITSKPIERIK